MKRFLVGGLIIISLLLVAAAGPSFSTPENQYQPNDPVKTKQGLVSGIVNTEGSVQIFKGIPYARPPVGDLRWKESQPALPWTGTRKCDEYGPNAVQAKPVPPWAYGQEILIPAADKISEDCLYLNIWAPVKRDKEKLPVMVIVHGGSFMAGSGSVAVLDGEQTAKKGVVVVSINYRLGIFGFLAHPLLSKESPHHVSGNYGILDQIAALKWIKENIAAFGGDPENITATGASAGSCTIQVMVASLLGRNLFQRVISESGPLFKPRVCPVLKDAEQDGLNTMQKKNALSLAAMRGLPASELLAGDYRREPVIDGYVLPDELIKIFKAGKQNDVDLLIGYNEGDDGLESAGLNAMDFNREARRKYGMKADDFLKLYPAANDEQAKESQRHESRDLIFAWENYEWARLQSSHGNRKAWFFYFSRAAPGQPYFGVFHGSQSAYALGNLGKWNRPWTDYDRELSNTMNDYWIHFAKTGDPNDEDLPEWPRFSAANTRVMGLGNMVSVIPLPAAASFEFFKSDPEVSF